MNALAVARTRNGIACMSCTPEHPPQAGSRCMTSHKIKRGCAAVCLTVLCSLAVSQQMAQADDSATSVVQKGEWCVPEGGDNQTLTHQVVEPSAGESAKLFIITGPHKQVLYEDSAVGHPIGFFPMADCSDLLVTLWMGGSAYQVAVFAYQGKKVEQVLEIGCRALPEFAELNGLMPLEIIAPKFEWVVDQSSGKRARFATKADIYAWDGRQFAVVEERAWLSRFKPLGTVPQQ